MALLNVSKMVSNFIQCKEETVPKYFTQFNIYENYQLNCKYVNDRNIQGITTDLKVNSAKIIDTIQGTSIEGQHLTGKKIIVIGSLDVNIIFGCPKCINKFCNLQKNMPFSTFIIIPSQVCEEQAINLKYLIEDITATIIKEGKIFINSTMLIQYVDEY